MRSEPQLGGQSHPEGRSGAEDGGAVDAPGHLARVDGGAGGQRWTLSAGQLIDIGKWNLLRHIPVKMRGGRR